MILVSAIFWHTLFLVPTFSQAQSRKVWAVHCSQKYTNRSKVLLGLYIIVSVCAPITNPQFVIFEWHLQLLLEYTAGEESFFNAFLFVAFKGRRRTLLFVAKAPLCYTTGRKEWQYHEKRSASAFTFSFSCPLFSSHETIPFLPIFRT